MKRWAAILILLIGMGGIAHADVSLYLYPRINYSAKVLFSQIGMIEGDPDSVERIKGLQIDENFITGGYLDKRDIMKILKENIEDKINIYGSGVRIIKQDMIHAAPAARITVKKGDIVRFQVVNSLIRIEMQGTAMKDGALGEVIPVRLKGTATSSGKILSERIVELVL
jgi:hypothetical protein